MSFFSPITERSPGVRLLYLTFYLLLSIGSLAMVIPFVIMLSGSVEPGTRLRDDALFFPSYLVKDADLWPRYLEAKYRGSTDLFQMAWNDPQADFTKATLLKVQPEDPTVLLWEKFLKENTLPEILFTTGFCNTFARIPYYNNRAFRKWLEARYPDVATLNQTLGTTFRSFNTIRVPDMSVIGPMLQVTPFITAFMEFSQESVPQNRKFVWDAGAVYRQTFLPRLIGRSVTDFNEKFGTSYASYAEVPFPSEAPEIATDAWHQFVSKLLRPNFVDFTPVGQKHFEASGLRKGDFIRRESKPEDLRVVTLDRQFASWAKLHAGLENARIPQATLDALAFEKEKGFWRRVFLVQNYQFVCDEIFLHGRALWNTIILAALRIGGILLVNPLAAYALSRYKLKKTYHILLFFMATIAFPAEVTMIPVFLQLREFNMLNSFWALVLPGLANGFSIFLLKGFFDSLPRELYEAAELDGASEWKMFWIITMNLSKPILAVLTLGAFVAAYGAFFFALILCPDPRMWTLMVYIYQLQMSAGQSVIYASLVLTAIPTLLIFVFCQNIILRGIVVPSEK